MKNVLLFADPGIDDSIAIMYALLHPEINVVGIVTGYGNVDKEHATNNVAYLLELANREDVPIIGGASRPMTGDFPTFYPEIHGPEGLGPIRPPDEFSGTLDNISVVFDIIHKYPDLTIVDVGRKTSLAIAYLLNSNDIKNINEFYIMGGAFLVPGNVTPYAEANFYGDPLASQIIVQNLTNVTIVPLNVSNNAIVTMDVVKEIQKASNNPLIELLDEVMEYYINAYKKIIPGIKGAPLHDVLTLSLMMNPEMGRSISRDVTLNEEEPAKGQSLADFRIGSEQSKKGTVIYLDLDYSKFINDFINILSSPL
ncbi:nucleoside hydrolase [Rossellomorea sp. BNER]|uniref:nucleoside hydrolase n=1 Tax=Rossellomorea sp. BNER TaxID=2962031 RepID=UPI003AF2E5CD|nr:nucleoside hydrolase [Rossellomorea sp. BNER]